MSLRFRTLIVVCFILVSTGISANKHQSEFKDYHLSVSSSNTGTFENRILNNKNSHPEILLFTESRIKEAMSEFKIPGVAVTIVKDGEVILSEGFGFADFKNKIPVSPQNTLVPVASISKTTTILALLQLIEQGKVRLTDIVHEILEMEPFSKQDKPITIENLVTHSSGFEESFFGRTLTESGKENLELLQSIQIYREQVVRPVGKNIVYSNYGINLLGAVIEKVSGKPFAQYMSEEVFLPLEMKSSQYVDSKIPNEKLHHRFVGHMWDGYQYQDSRERYTRIGNYPAGGLQTTAEDMAKYMRFLLDVHSSVNPPVLSNQSKAELRKIRKRNHASIGGVTMGLWSSEVFGLNILEHDGIRDGMASKMSLVPELNLGIFISTNSSGGYQLTRQFYYDLIKYLTAATNTNNSKATSDYSTDLEHFTGSYLMAWGNSTTLEKITAHPIYIKAVGNALFVNIGLEESLWYPISNGLFESQETGEKIAFRLDADRKMILYSKNMIYTKISPWDNSRTFLLLAIVGMLLSILVVCRYLYKCIRARYRRKLSTIDHTLAIIAVGWSTFTLSFFYTLSESIGKLSPSILVDFPDTATNIGQLVLILVLVTVGIFIFNIKELYSNSDKSWLSKSSKTVYISLIVFLLVWSNNFNLLGFQY